MGWYSEPRSAVSRISPPTAARKTSPSSYSSANRRTRWTAASSTGTWCWQHCPERLGAPIELVLAGQLRFGGIGGPAGVSVGPSRRARPAAHPKERLATTLRRVLVRIEMTSLRSCDGYTGK